MLAREAFRRELRLGVRIGAGGLWGGFSWLCHRGRALDLYVSRTDRLVLVRLE
jgi:hypothetical protein